MYRQILTPDKENHSIELPEDLYGKKIEVIAFEINEMQPSNTGVKNFLDDIEPIPDFPGIEKIRKNGWPEKW